MCKGGNRSPRGGGGAKGGANAPPPLNAALHAYMTARPGIRQSNHGVPLRGGYISEVSRGSLNTCMQLRVCRTHSLI